MRGKGFLRRRVKILVRIAPIHGFMFFFGPAAWQLWMALRLGFVSPEEALRCLLSPRTAGSVLFIRADKDIAALRGSVGKESTQ